MVKLEEGSTSGRAFAETTRGVCSGCCDVAELSTTLPPYALIPQGHIPIRLAAENC